MSVEQKTLSTVLKDLLNKSNRETHCALPAIVQKYDFKTQKASVKVNIKRTYQDSSVDMPVLSNVPVMFMSSGGAALTMPVKNGDSCLLICCDVDIKSWLLGGDNIVPQTTRSHSLNDAVAIVGLNPFTKALEVENNDDVLLSYSGSKIRLKPNGIVDIHNAKEVNVKTESVIINCKNANVKAEESIIAECKNAQVKSTESTSIECKNASIKSSEATSIDCRTASIKASESANIECKVAAVKSIESTSIECKSASVKAAESVIIEAKIANLKTTESTSIDCKTANIKAAENANIECHNAIVKASGAINTETPNFTQKGNMKIDGNIEVTGTSELKGDATCSATITGNAVKTSSGKDLATHTHGYTMPIAGSTPTGVTPNTPTGMAQ